VAVHDAAGSAKLFRDVLGAGFVSFGDNEEQGFRFVQYRFPGGGKVELVTPIGEGFVSRFLDRRGEGIHHITLTVTDLRSQVDRMRAGGIDPVMVDLEDPHWREAFIHPKNAHGVLVQLAESLHEGAHHHEEHLRRMGKAALELGLA
jgi:methylmalonyl-CoA/ethylmalonyl-CoA epimerase